MEMKGKVGTREFVAVILLLIGSKIADTTPTILVQETRNSFWMIPIVSFVIFLPSFLLFLYLLKKYKNKNLIQLINAILGRYVGLVMGIIIFLAAFSTLILDSRGYVDELSVLYYPSTPLLVIFGTLLLICWLGAKIGLQPIFSAAWLILPYIKASVILLFILALANSEWRRIFPLWGDGVNIILKESLYNVSIYTDVFVLAMAYTSLISTNSFHRASRLGLMIVAIELAVSFLFYATTFDYKSIDKIAYHFNEVTQYIQLGTYFTNVETYFMFFWLLAVFIRFIIYLYFTTWVFGAIFKIKNFQPLLLPFAALTIAIGVLPENQIEMTLVYRKTLMSITSVLFLVTPITLWFVAKMKGDLRT